MVYKRFVETASCLDFHFVVLQNPNEYCMLVALPCGQDHLDIIMQSNNLRAGFISYLQQKQAAGIVNIANPVSSQVTVNTVFCMNSFQLCCIHSKTLGR